jgi:hypothetical protein
MTATSVKAKKKANDCFSENVVVTIVLLVRISKNFNVKEETWTRIKIRHNRTTVAAIHQALAENAVRPVLPAGRVGKQRSLSL